MVNLLEISSIGTPNALHVLPIVNFGDSINEMPSARVKTPNLNINLTHNQQYVYLYTIFVSTKHFLR